MSSAWKDFIDAKMLLISKERFILDLGGGTPFQKWLAEYKPLFDGVEYKTFDYNLATNPDIVGDIHDIPLGDGLVDAVICSSVLEHVRNPVRAMEEIYRILKKGGKLFLYVPSIHPYHARPGAYPDYWRFFDDTLIEMCKGYERVELQKRGGHIHALASFIPPQKYLGRFYRSAASFLDNIFRTEQRTTTEGYYVFAVK